MQRAVARQTLDGDDVTGVELMEESDAGVDRPILETVAGGTTHQHRARAAVAFRAHHLGADQAQLVAQILGEGREGGGSADAAPRPVEVEDEMVAHRL